MIACQGLAYLVLISCEAAAIFISDHFFFNFVKVHDFFLYHIGRGVLGGRGHPRKAIEKALLTFLLWYKFLDDCIFLQPYYPSNTEYFILICLF